MSSPPKRVKSPFRPPEEAGPELPEEEAVPEEKVADPGEEEAAPESEEDGTIVLFLDTETTGINPTKAHCVEIALIRAKYRGREKVSQRQHVFLVKPPIPIPEGAAEVHHITDELVADCSSAAELEDDLLQIVEGADIIVAHNLPYDAKIVGREFPGAFCVEEDGKKSWRVPVGIDTLRIVRRLWPLSPDHKLQTLREFLELASAEEVLEACDGYTPGLGEGETGEHRAMFDTKVCQLLCEEILAHHFPSFDALVKSLETPVVLEIMPFGKHKGLTFAEIKVQRPSYLRWLRGQPWVKHENPDLYLTVQQYL